jgi:predicted permease
VTAAFLQDLRFALRTLRKSPGSTAIIVLSLALGIGANTAVFTLLNAVLLRDLPVERPAQLFALDRVSPHGRTPRFSYPAYERLRAAGGHVRIAALTPVFHVQTRSGSQDWAPAVARFVTGEFFPLLGLKPSAGRLLSPGDDRPGGNVRTAVISYRLWKTKFALSPGVIGRAFEINGLPISIVGVAPSGFSSVSPGEVPDLWLPTALQHEIHYAQNASIDNADGRDPWRPQEGVAWLTLLVRVQPAAAFPQASARLRTLFQAEVAHEASLYPSDGEFQAQLLSQRLEIEPARRGLAPLRQKFGTPLAVLMAIVAVVLAIACANVANILLARATRRRKEMGIRVSLGAGSRRLLAQLLVESLLLSGSGGALGLLSAQWASRTLVRLASSGRDPMPLNLSPDFHVLAFTAAVTLLTGFAFGLAPAWRASRTDVAETLRGGATRRGSSRRTSAGKVLVAGQAALSLLLLAGAGLFVQTLRNLTSLDPGFDHDHGLNAAIDPLGAGYREAELPALYDRLTRGLESLPGVRSASVSLSAIGTGSVRTSSIVVASPTLPSGSEDVQVNVVGTGYFETVGMPIRQGRSFATRDRSDTRKVAVVNQALARRYFSTSDAVGRTLGFDSDREFQIVGVVQDARVHGYRRPSQPMLYLPASQHPGYLRNLDIRVAGDPRAAEGAVRRKIQEAAPRLTIYSLSPVSEDLARSVQRERLVAVLSGLFGTIALALAILGLYGVMSCVVARRSGEFGIRMALGATRPALLGLVLSESASVVGVGLLAGLPLALTLPRLVSSLFFGLGPTDLPTISGAAAVLFGAAVVAALVPARRASKIDPMAALRYE